MLALPPSLERDRLVGRLLAHQPWAALPLQRLDTRLEVVRRLTFHREPALLAHASPGQGG